MLIYIYMFNKSLRNVERKEYTHIYIYIDADIISQYTIK